MLSRHLAFVLVAALVSAGSIFGAGSAAAQQPSAAAVATAMEVLESKGGLTMFEPIVPGVVETAKNVFLQQSPNLQKDLNETAAALRAQLAPRTKELKEEVKELVEELEEDAALDAAQ